MALVELHCDVVTVPIVQQDPIVLCCGDLWQRHFLSHPTPRSSSTGWRAGQTEDPQLKEKCVQNSPPLPPQGKHPPGGAVPGWQPHPTPTPTPLKFHPQPVWPGPGRGGQMGQLRPGNSVPGGKTAWDHLPREDG